MTPVTIYTLTAHLDGLPLLRDHTLDRLRVLFTDPTDRFRIHADTLRSFDADPTLELAYSPQSSNLLFSLRSACERAS